MTLQAISEPKSDYKSPLDAFKVSLGHEQKVSAAICAIYELAAEEKDYATLSFLKWFLDEQVEEEKNVGDHPGPTRTGWGQPQRPLSN